MNSALKKPDSAVWVAVQKDDFLLGFYLVKGPLLLIDYVRVVAMPPEDSVSWAPRPETARFLLRQYDRKGDGDFIEVAIDSDTSGIGFWRRVIGFVEVVQK